MLTVPCYKSLLHITSRAVNQLLFDHLLDIGRMQINGNVPSAQQEKKSTFQLDNGGNARVLVLAPLFWQRSLEMAS